MNAAPDDIAQGMEEALASHFVKRKGSIYTLRNTHGTLPLPAGMQGRVWRRPSNGRIVFAIPEELVSGNFAKGLPCGVQIQFRGERGTPPELWRYFEHLALKWYLDGMETEEEVLAKYGKWQGKGIRILPF